MGVGGSVFSILAQFLSNRSQHVMVDGCWIKLFNVVVCSAEGLYFGPIIVLPIYSGAHICRSIIIIIIILLKQEYKVQLANNKIQMAWLTSWLVVG